jgi:hypothetical protein
MRHSAYCARLETPVDPWALPLERLRGKVGDDGIERITTQTVFDTLEVPQRSRGAGACRRLARLMTGLGWTTVRVRGLNGCSMAWLSVGSVRSAEILGPR